MPISFKVRVNEPTGSEVQVVGTFDGEEIVAVLKGRSAPGPGETAELVLRIRPRFIFSTKTPGNEFN